MPVLKEYDVPLSFNQWRIIGSAFALLRKEGEGDTTYRTTNSRIHKFRGVHLKLDWPSNRGAPCIVGIGSDTGTDPESLPGPFDILSASIRYKAFQTALLCSILALLIGCLVLAYQYLSSDSSYPVLWLVLAPLGAGAVGYALRWAWLEMEALFQT